MILKSVPTVHIAEYARDNTVYRNRIHIPWFLRSNTHNYPLNLKNTQATKRVLMLVFVASLLGSVSALGASKAPNMIIEVPTASLFDTRNFDENTYIPIRMSPFKNLETYLEGRKEGLIKFTLTNVSSDESNWGLHAGDHDIVAFHQRGKKTVKIGYMVTGSKKAFKWNSFYHSVHIPPGQSIVVYAHFNNSMNLYHKVLPHVLPFREVVQKKMNDYIIDFLFQGILLVVIIYNIGLFTYSRDKTYLFYGGYIFFAAIFYLFINRHFRELVLSETPGLMHHPSISVLLAFSCFMLFIKSLFRSSNTLSEFEGKFFNSVAIGNVVFAVFILGYIETTNDPYLEITLVKYLAASNSVVIIIYLADKYYTKKIFGYLRYAFSGVLLFAFLVIIEAILWEFNKQPELTKYGFIGQIIIFSFGLGEKIRQETEERKLAQEALIHTLKENEDLVLRKQEDLENLVVERTALLQKRNRELEEAKLLAESISRSKSDFLSVMSHEIRTPMNAVVGLIYLLSDENKDDALNDNFRTLKYSAENLLWLINEVLDYNKMESGNLTRENKTFAIDDICSKVSDLFRPNVAQKGIEYYSYRDPEIPDYLIGDPTYLTQVLNNLHSNAIKFTSIGSIRFSATVVKRSPTKISVCFSVVDSGIGIPLNKQRKIFKKFGQASADTKGKFGGTGLGLTISKGLVALMGGELRVHSAPGNGAEFYFSIQFDIPKDLLHREREKEDESRELVGTKILIVDDNEINRKLLGKFMRKWKADFRSVGSGNKALELLEDEPFDVVLSDIHMPDMDGYDLASRIRHLETGKKEKTPIIAITADVGAEVKLQIKNAGIDEFVGKPFQPKELFDKIFKLSRKEVLDSKIKTE